MSLYRLYVDEVGNHDMSENADERFLSLTGVIIESEYCKNVFNPEMDKLKRDFFLTDPDEPIIFHRKEMVNKRKCFYKLQNKDFEESFNSALLSNLVNWNYRVITIVIDKMAHLKLYGKACYHPYHYCMSALLERYVLFLRNHSSTGDVMVEARGGREDEKLKEIYTEHYNSGSKHINIEILQNHLTSSQLKVKNKKHNINGLQLADLIAHPSRREILREHGLIQDGRNTFGDSITEILCKSKYDRHYKTGRIEGFGKKLLS